MTQRMLVAGLVWAVMWASAQDASLTLRRVDELAPRYGEISRQIWENPELGFQEVKSAALLREELRRAGFRIQDEVAGLQTAFIAEWGEGKPVIAVLGEYDALPSLSQEDVPERKPRVPGAPGHGCGHNLFGAGSALGVVAARDEMQRRGLRGTLRYYGTPAEEGGGGKIYMIRAGAFRDVDAVLVWHPSSENRADDNSWLANIGARIRYTGRASHAAASPEDGRSALDAVEIMAHAVNLLREHVPQETRMHYVVTQGGTAANVVPETAEVSIIVRHPNLSTLEGIWERVLNCAQAGALATGTQMEVEVTSGYANVVPNTPLSGILDRALHQAGGVHYTEEERQFARKLVARADLSGTAELGSEATILPPRKELLPASTDVGDVSWHVPTGQFFAATFPPGVSFHTWQSTACAGTTLGRKGMVVAAKTIALAAVELFAQPAVVQDAQADFEKRLTGRSYRSLLPQDKKPGPR